MATSSQPKLLAQGKQRMLGGSTRGWRVRPYAPTAGSNNYQVFFRAPAGAGEPWKRVPARRRLRGGGAQDLRPGRAGAGHRAGAAGRCRRPRVTDDSDARRGVPRGQPQARQATTHHGGSDLAAQRPHRADHRRRTGGEVAHPAQPRGHGEGVRHAPLPARPGGPARPDGGDAQAGVALGLARPLDRPARRPRHRAIDGAARSHHPLRRPATATRDPTGASDGRCSRQALRSRRHRPADDATPVVRHQDPRRRLRRPPPRRAERPARDRRLLRPRLRPRQRLMGHAAPRTRLPRPGEEPGPPRSPAPPLADATNCSPASRNCSAFPPRHHSSR
jgi:hypothetical protein